MTEHFQLQQHMMSYAEGQPLSSIVDFSVAQISFSHLKFYQHQVLSHNIIMSLFCSLLQSPRNNFPN